MHAYEPLTDDLRTLTERATAVRERVARELPDLSRRLEETAALRGWNVSRCDGVEDGARLCRAIGAETRGDIRGPVAAAGVRKRCRWTQRWQAPARCAGRRCTTAPDSREAVRRRLSESSMGITGADYAIAETGSVIVLPRRGLSRLVSVVPPVHVAIVRPQDILGTLDDLFTLRRLEYYQNGEHGNHDMGSYLNFITGPSRTADIEQTIVVGVHGPREVHMILLDEE